MKIKKVEENTVDYPNANEVSTNEVKKKIPKKFLVLGALGIGAAVVGGVAYYKSRTVEAVTAGVLEKKDAYIDIQVPEDGVIQITDDVLVLDQEEENSGELDNEEIGE